MPKTVFAYFLIGVVASLDNLAVGLSFGLRKVNIPFNANLIIGLLSGIMSAIFVVFGKYLSSVISFANILGALILVTTGLVFIFPNILSGLVGFCRQIFLHQSENRLILRKPHESENDIISLSQTVIFGIALSLNCISTGLGAGLTGFKPIPVAIWTTVLSILTIKLGNLCARQAIGKGFARWTQPISGLILIAIGILDLM